MHRALIQLGAAAIVLTAASRICAQSGIVFLSAETALGGPAKLVRFDNGVQTLQAPDPGDHAFYGVTELNGEILVADYLDESIRRYSPTGSYLGNFASPGFSPTWLESDSRGNVYATSFIGFPPSVARRFNSAGVATATINLPPGSWPAGVDADAAGNIYTVEAFDSQLYKHSANGTYINQISLGFRPEDLAIDEIGQRLFVVDNGLPGSIKVYNIAGVTPTLIGSIPTPANADFFGIHFYAQSGHIFATDSLNPRAFEFSSAGVLLHQYVPLSTYLVADVTTLEPRDYNNDGVWDGADYVMWRKGHPAADGNKDGLVNGTDYNVWRKRYGQPSLHGYGGNASPNFAPAIPEPTTFLLSIAAIIGALVRRRRAATCEFRAA